MVQNVFTEQLTGSTLTLTSANGQSVALTASNTGSLLSGGSEVGTGGGGSGVTVYANSSVFPLDNLTAGEMAFANNNNTLYLTNGFGWYKIALINTDPSVTANVTAVSLGGTANTILVGYTVTEPEGTPVTVTIANSGIANTSQGNIVHYTANNTLEINNFAGEGSEWSANVTITVSDGVGIAAASFSVSVVYAPDPNGILYDTVGSHTFTVPADVYSFSAVAVGGGGGGTSYNSNGGWGGAGAALAYVNDVACNPGDTYTVVVGAGGARGTNSGAGNGGDSSITRISDSTVLVRAGGGSGAGSSGYATGGAVIVGTGGAGGRGGLGSASDAGGGGGAGGYSGQGGDGPSFNYAGVDGAGGGGGSGGAGGSGDMGGAGGGVGLYGQGANGTGGTYGGADGGPGGGGSGGEDGTASVSGTYGDGGKYGGGGAGAEFTSEHGNGGQGGVRIIWGGNFDRQFPTTNVGDSSALLNGQTETTV